MDKNYLQMGTGRLHEIVTEEPGRCIVEGFDMTNLTLDQKLGHRDPVLQAAARICAECTVRDQCLALGILDGVPGSVYGGVLLRWSGMPVDLNTGEKLNKAHLKERLADDDTG